MALCNVRPCLWPGPGPPRVNFPGAQLATVSLELFLGLWPLAPEGRLVRRTNGNPGLTSCDSWI